MFRKNEILKKSILADQVIELQVYSPAIAESALPGQFIMYRISEYGERVPLTIAETCVKNGSVTIVVQTVGESTLKLAALEEGDCITDFAGPFGNPSDLPNNGRVAVIGGGLGCAIAYPQAKAMFLNNVKVDLIAGFRSKSFIFWEDKMRSMSTNLIVCTDDSSYGYGGFVTAALEQQIKNNANYDMVLAVGPLPMMRAVSELTRKYGIKTIVSMNTLMIDATGMCGGCRLKVGGVTRFACVDGPDFDGHEVDFNEVIRRNNTYKELEINNSNRQEHDCRLLDLTETKEFKVIKDKTTSINNSKVKTKMAEQPPLVRNKNFDEVSLGYSDDEAIEEARRCLNCKHKPCVSGCPVAVQIPEFIDFIKQGEFEKAYQKISQTNTLPAVCGRVCPQEKQCEKLCVRTKSGEAVAIGNLERFAADYHRNNKPDEELACDISTSTRVRVAVIGSGPSSLACAGELSSRCYDVTIFEALHLAGGVLSYGIPEFRLPKSIVADEINNLVKQGVNFELNTIIGRTKTVDKLFEEGFDAIFIGSGAGLPVFMDIPGEGLNGVYSANEYLTRINLMKAYLDEYDTPIKRSKRLAVIGGGNVAMDAARCAIRLGTEKVYIIYRRGEEELPARAEEIHHAKEEQIEFMLLTNPIRILGDEKGNVTGIECVKMQLGEPDKSGRRSPVKIENSEFITELDAVIIAVGTSPNPLIKKTTEGLETDRHGCLKVVDEHGVQTTREGIFAGGDAVTGAATVILAMGSGKKAADEIDKYIQNKKN